MDHRKIEIFRAIMDQGSVTAAARALGLAQPTVSNALANFERELGITLFRRSSRRLVPTAEAKLLHNEAIHVLNGLERFGVSAEETCEGRRGTLTIATNPNPAISWLPSIAAEFRRQRPNVRLRFLSRSSAEVRELAAASALDLGIAEAPFANAEWVLERYAIPRVAALPRKHLLAAHDVLSPKLLDGEDMIAVVPSSWNWALVTRAFDRAGAVCNVVAECEYMATALAMTAHGAGICLADPISAETIGLGLIQRPFLPVTPYEVGLLGPAHRNLTVLAKAFAEVLHNHISSYLEHV
jgi:DNA-binding transcriptional LysR family regulator